MLSRHVRALGQAPLIIQPLIQLTRSLTGWATVDPERMSGSAPAACLNLVGGHWLPSGASRQLPDPLNGEHFLQVPHTQPDEIGPFVQSLRAVPKSGLHNPLKDPQRQAGGGKGPLYLLYGDVSFRVAAELRLPEVEQFFARLIQRVAPKSQVQALGEVRVTRKFFENFSGDQVRFLARGFTNPGDHSGQTSSGNRWPYGPVALITPFNFPLEIPALQLMGALYMGNKPLLHVDQRVSVVAEQLLRLLHHCGMPPADVDLLHGPGATVGEVLRAAQPRSTLFTGSQRVAERLAVETHGKVFLEDAGFDWKILGPDVRDLDYVAWQCDQDAYACSGQKCSAHNWIAAGLLDRLSSLASRRQLYDLTVGPVLSWTTRAMLEHTNKLLAIPAGAKLLFGGKPLSGHSIPEVYGAVEPTAVFVPLDQMLLPEYFDLVTTEVFGPFQVVTEWREGQLPAVLEACERMSHHLTAAVVSNDINFVQHVLAHTVNGTTYAGIRARTTGAPQNHWFGPAGDPRGAGIGTPEAIRLVWSCHREIITDFGPVPPHTTPLVQS
ncbi:aldehyde dehydrogenase [Volvox carteri f. nagariensis]|uniref:Aldehyde dehydrogenase n=1 Tax=Volvox carteri f. nagariensis TaxID=3068 RepID=D8UHH5_VOLCA|nr:aldehyde dehydrogenase [Volvox carteri f. nagariensis]EFJ40853.1 aldehyde dehydrogenase [Volvox carteri f. nagariensis]|eukprot:XP_002958122.1 aldehyde dehydrogenase [Volvox carteri f. nagariensis]